MTRPVRQDSVTAITRVPGGPSADQVRLWAKRGYLRPVKKPTSKGTSFYQSYNEEERFVAVVIARLLRTKIPAKIAVPAARKAWMHPVGQHKVRLADGVFLVFHTKADGTPQELPGLFRR